MKKEKGEERQKMKKLLSILAVLILLIGAIGVTFNFGPVVAVGPPYYLTIETDPAGILGLDPDVGVYKYDVEHWVNCTAPSEYVDGDTKYEFDQWTVSVDTGEWSAGAGQMWVHVDCNKTATAHYKTFYKFTVDVQGCGTPKIYGGVGGNTWQAINETWVEANTNVWAGVFDLICCIGGTYGVYICPNQWQGFVNWTGPGISGAVHYADTPPYHWMQSNPINMTEPKTAEAKWKYIYKLYVYSDPASAPGLPSTGWHEKCTNVTLTATKVPWLSANKARWLFDHWDVEDPSCIVDSYNETVVIHMEKNNTATAFYRRQSWITLWDNTGNLTGIRDTGKWYYNCVPLTFTVDPEIIVTPDDTKWVFVKWVLVGTGTVGTNPTLQIHLNGPSPYDGGTLKAVYKLQYFVTLDTVPSGLPTTVEIEGSSISGPPPLKGWFDKGSTIKFRVPDIAVFVAGNYKWVFDTRWQPGAYKCWWKNGIKWGLGGTNDSWRVATLGTLTGAVNVTAHYRKYYFVDYDTIPAGLGWQGSKWWPEGISRYIHHLAGGPPGSFGDRVFKQIFDNGPSQGIGVDDYKLDGGSLSQSHIIRAEYVNKTAFILNQAQILKIAPATCTNFTTTVYAANFDAGRGRDLWAMDFHIYWNATLINLVKIEYTDHLNNLWGTGKWFVAKGTSISEEFYDSANGWTYIQFVATALKGANSHVGPTKPVVTLTFHIKLDPCYPTVYESPIKFSTKYPTEVTNSTGHPIGIELTYGAHYKIEAPQPIVQIELSETPIQSNDPQQYFDAYVNIKLGIKVTDFHIWILYPKDLIAPVKVTFGDYLPGPAFTSRGYTFYLGQGKIKVWAYQDIHQSPHAYGNGTLFIIEFKVITATFWQNGPLTGDIKIDKANSYLSVCCPYPKIQHFSDVIAHDETYIYDPLPGDLNFDGVVNVADLRLLASKYGDTITKAGDPYDVDRDGDVDLIDLVLIALHFGDHI